MQFGRNVLYTDVKEITRDNIAEILRLVMPLHEQNAVKMTSLLEYEAGNQQKLRIKKFRPEINNWCVDNVANEVTEFKLSYNWGNPITLSMRGKNEEADKTVIDGIYELNKFYVRFFLRL